MAAYRPTGRVIGIDAASPQRVYKPRLSLPPFFFFLCVALWAEELPRAIQIVPWKGLVGVIAV